MVKRSRVDYSSGNGGRRGAVIVQATVQGRARLVSWWCVALLLWCGAGGVGGAVASGSGSLGDRSQAALHAAAERIAAAGPAAGRYADDATAAARNGRSAANLSHITGTARKIKMFVKNRYLQVFPDGAVNSTAEDTSDYVILQRTSVNMGQLKIQGVATCMYLCMDACGLLYGSKDFEDECVFNEMIEQHHYNTYSSAKYTNDKRTLYLALNKRGLPRKVQVKANAPLGKLSTYTQVLTQPVSADRVDQLLAARRPMSAEWPASVPHGHRHHHACPPHVQQATPTKHRKSGRKCQAKGGGGGGGGGRKKAKEPQQQQQAGDGGGGSREEEDCAGGNKKGGGRCGGGDETGHRKADAAGRKKKSKKPTSGGGGGGGNGKGDKPHRLQSGKSKKSEPAADAAQIAVTTAVAPSQLVDENDGGGDDDDDDATAAATAPTTTTDD